MVVMVVMCSVVLCVVVVVVVVLAYTLGSPYLAVAATPPMTARSRPSRTRSRYTVLLPELTRLTCMKE